MDTRLTKRSEIGKISKRNRGQGGKPPLKRLWSAKHLPSFVGPTISGRQRAASMENAVDDEDLPDLVGEEKPFEHDDESVLGKFQTSVGVEAFISQTDVQFQVEPDMKNASTQTSPTHHTTPLHHTTPRNNFMGNCKRDCQYMFDGRFCSDDCQFLHLLME